MSYKRAFRCNRCPENDTKEGCPMWWELVMDNVQTGESKLVKACGYSLLPIVLTHVVSASNRPAAALESLRNTMLKMPHVSVPDDVTERLGVAHEKGSN